MTEAEMNDFRWNDLLQKAYKQGLAAGSTTISRDIIIKVLDAEYPWDKEQYLANYDEIVVDATKDMTKEAWLRFYAYETFRQTPKDGKLAMCVAKFAKWSSDATQRDQAFAICAGFTDEASCTGKTGECEVLKP